MTTYNGKAWKSQRSFTLRTLRNLGFGKSKFEGKIHDELKYMTDKIDDKIKEANDTPIRILEFLGPAISNTIGLMTTGIRYDYDHPIRKDIDKIFIFTDQTSIGFTFFSWASYFPAIIKIILMLPTRASKQAAFFFTYIINYVSCISSERKVAIDAMNDAELLEESDNYIDVYIKRLREIDNSSSDDKEYFSSKYNPTYVILFHNF